MLTEEQIANIKTELDTVDDELLKNDYAKFIIDNGYKIPNFNFLLEDLNELVNYLNKLKEDNYSYEYYGTILQEYIKNDTWEKFVKKCDEIKEKEASHKVLGKWLSIISIVLIFVIPLAYLIFYNDIFLDKLFASPIVMAVCYIVKSVFINRIIKYLESNKYQNYLTSKEVKKMFNDANVDITNYAIDKKRNVFLKIAKVDNLFVKGNYFPYFDKDQKELYINLADRKAVINNFDDLINLVNKCIVVINEYNHDYINGIIKNIYVNNKLNSIDDLKYQVSLVFKEKYKQQLIEGHQKEIEKEENKYRSSGNCYSDNNKDYNKGFFDGMYYGSMQNRDY